MPENDVTLICRTCTPVFVTGGSMRTKMKNKVIAFAMSLAMVFTMMPMMGAQVYAASKSNFYSGADVLRDGSNTSGAATVHMAGTKWHVIGYGVSQEGGIPQVASSADTMTLIAADNLKTGVQFNPVSNQVNTYKDSNLYNEVNALTDDTNGLFSKGEKEGIVPRDLEPKGYTSTRPYTNGIAGDKVEGALLWPLSTQEAFYMDSELRNVGNYWWLRSPGSRDGAAFVYNDGYLLANAYRVVNDICAVRPAFNFNLKSVIFTSAAAGGKSSAAGSDSLEKIGEYMSGEEWKLTLKDGAHNEFKVNKVTTAGEGKLKIEYSDAAVDGEKEYISAIVKTSAGGGEQFASWYGKLALAEKASGANNPSCELTIPKNLEAGDEIYVFNEQCNANAITEGDTTTPAETDYASEPIKVYTAPNPKITEQPAEELKLTYGDTTGNVLSVEAEAATGNTLSYQWYYKDSPSLVSGTKIDNGTGASYTVPTDENVGKKLYYYCVVTEKDQYSVEMSSKSNLAAVTVNKAKLTIKPKDQTFTYNGWSQGPGDVIYSGPQVDERIDYDKDNLKFNDYLSNITVDGQGQNAGTYDLEPSAVNIQDGKYNKVNDNYDITLENGKLIIGKAPITIKADYKNCKDLDNADPFTWTMEDEANKWYEAERADITLTVTDDKGTVIDPKTAAAGKYKIVPSWKTEDKNYEATFVNGTFEKHKLTPHNEVPPTCIAPGTEAYWSCGLCSKMFSDKDGSNAITEQEEIPATGHKYGAWAKFDDKQHQRVCEHDTAHVEKAAHTWDAGKVTKDATEQAEGVKTFTCTVCKATKTETIPKLDPAPTPKPVTPKVSGTPLAKMTAKKKSITIGWNKIQGSAGYDIFFARCNHDSKKIVTKKVKTIKGNKTFKWTKSGLKKGTAYKAYVRAYVTKNGKKTYVSKSPIMHAYTGNGTKKYTNAKSVKVNKTKVTLTKGKTFKIKAKVKKISKKKKLMPKSHAPTLRYMTSNSKIASVNSGGKITAKGKGTCYIYVYAHNGVSKRVKVTVQ